MCKTKLRILFIAIVFSHLDCPTLLVCVAQPFAPVELDHVGALVAQEVYKQLLLDLWELDLYEETKCS